MRALALTALALFAWGCGSTPIEEWEPSTSALWRGPDEAVAQLCFDARVALERGEREAARAALDAALERDPGNLTARFLDQEYALTAPNADAAALLAEARAVAAAQGRSTLDALLAARLESDKDAARLLLEGALASELPADLEAACRYALAYVQLQLGNTGAANDELARSLALDPGGQRARRLEARLARGARDLEPARAMLAYWLDEAELSPVISSDMWYAALLELAELELALGEPGDAEDALERFAEGRGEGRFRGPSDRRLAIAELLWAAILADDGEPEQALDRVERARGLVSPASRTGRLVLIDKALLNELYLDRELDALAAWEAVLDRFEGASGVDTDELLRALEARIRLARLRAAQPR